MHRSTHIEANLYLFFRCSGEIFPNGRHQEHKSHSSICIAPEWGEKSLGAMRLRKLRPKTHLTQIHYAEQGFEILIAWITADTEG